MSGKRKHILESKNEKRRKERRRKGKREKQHTVEAGFNPVSTAVKSVRYYR